MATRTAPTLNKKPSCSFSLISSRRCRSIGNGRIMSAMFIIMLQTAISIRLPTARLHATSVVMLADRRWRKLFVAAYSYHRNQAPTFYHLVSNARGQFLGERTVIEGDIRRELL